MKYLWVDCLCILANSNDPNKETALIPAIYRNAAVTISAARARTSSDVFLRPITIPSPQDISFRLRFLCPNGQIGSIITYSEIGKVCLRFLNENIAQRRRYLNMIPGQTWLSLIQHYMERALTFSYDKLLAISGIAEFYATKMNNEDYAKSSLLSPLLWKRCSPVLPRPAEYRVPSLSWAAIDGNVRF